MNKKILLTAIVSVSVLFTNSAFATYGVQTKTTGCLANQILPDSACSPGAILTTDTKVICVSGYTKTVRNVTEATKKKVFKEYGIPYTQKGNYEVDHIISLELGGSNDISNLYPESYLIKNGARTKDIFENYLHKQACAGKMSMEEAQRQISGDWFYYYQTGMLKKQVSPSIPAVTNTITKPAETKTDTTNTQTPPVSVPSVVTQPSPAPVVIKPVDIIVPVVVAPVVEQPAPQPVVEPVVTTSDPEVKKSTSGICHARGTTYYSRTTNYTAYSSVDACLSSGGRLPK